MEMSRDEFYKKYGDEKVTFIKYAQLIFRYATTLTDGNTLVVLVMCKNMDDFCKHSVIVNRVETVRQLNPIMCIVYRDNEEIESFYDLQKAYSIMDAVFPQLSSKLDGDAIH